MGVHVCGCVGVRVFFFWRIAFERVHKRKTGSATMPVETLRDKPSLWCVGTMLNAIGSCAEQFVLYYVPSFTYIGLIICLYVAWRRETDLGSTGDEDDVCVEFTRATGVLHYHTLDLNLHWLSLLLTLSFSIPLSDKGKNLD